MVELYQEIRMLARMQKEFIEGINQIVAEFDAQKIAVYFEGMTTQKMTIVIRSSEIVMLDQASKRIVEFAKKFFLNDCKVYANKHQLSRYVTIREIDYYFTAYVRATKEGVKDETL